VVTFLTNGMSLALYALYAVIAVCSAGLLAVWIATNRSRRNAGFASKRHLKRELSAKTILRATEIRPSLTRGNDPSARTSGVDLTKASPLDS
jgi:hypothetical protein